eukprot:CAMPEP_0176329868 /NCGR_PEP_ID=MMETSP0121_2-20121125/75714_1 /TAXON_ID=160619 /ORGANISM="Kryptoperidinium foliaceum, Strain CCMP 1326" /LENGTH=54 /DNA_ID=CAMNT_0017672611 /DNA_START=15 /DNA_END=175 /DNA_ORIENTATION=+
MQQEQVAQPVVEERRRSGGAEAWADAVDAPASEDSAPPQAAEEPPAPAEEAAGG